MGRQPAFQFYPGDWLRDDGVQSTSWATRGMWIELLMRMWDAPERGKLSKTQEQFCRLLGCTGSDFDSAVKELSALHVAEVSRSSNGLVTIINRRMFREQKERDATKDRVRRHREKQECNAGITAPSSSSSSSSNSNSDVTCNYSVTELQRLHAHWAQRLRQNIPPENVLTTLRETLAYLEEQIAEHGLDLMDPVDILMLEIDALADKPPSKRTPEYFWGMVKGKLKDELDQTG